MKQCRTVRELMVALNNIPGDMELLTATSNHVSCPDSPIQVGVVTLSGYSAPEVYCLISNGFHQGQINEVVDISGAVRSTDWYVTKSGEISADGWSVVRAKDRLAVLENGDRSRAEALAALLNGNPERAKAFL